ncbi:MAG TPA: helix-turn-helix transcriptional regulator [Microthrixaceae bacterium]|nr:helix-turn-helix transcriptional regulator [Microthrixaceae bacterium]
MHLQYLRSTSTLGPALPAAADAEAASRGLPPGIWHAGSCLTYGAWSWTVGGDGAADILAEGAEEAALLGAPSVQAYCTALIAMIAHSEGDPARAWGLADRAYRLAADHDLLGAPAMCIVNSVHALATAAAGESEASRASWQLARSQLAMLTDVSGWTNVVTQLALAHASLLLGDRTGVETMVRELSQLLVRQPDAVGAHRQVAKVEELARRLRHQSAIGASSLTTAELRVLHYLPTNLSLAEIGDRLFVSRYTIKTHCSSIYRKLDATTRSGAVAAARAVGLLSGETSLDQT